MAEPNTDIAIREFDGSDADYEAVVTIANAWEPEAPTCVENVRFRDSVREKRYLFRRILAELDGRVVAAGNFGESNWSHVPGKYTLYFSVHPEYGGRGIGTALYEYITGELAKAEPAPRYFATWVREDREVAIRFIETRGFREVMRGANSCLNLAAFDETPFASARPRLAEQGIGIERLDRAMERVPDAMRRLYDLDWEAMQDMPNDDPPVRRSFETYRGIMQAPRFDPRLGYVALDGDDWVGVTLLWHNPADRETLETEITGVRRTHRRRGIATALKAAVLADARDLGFARVRTENAATNPMYGINVRLGFEPEPGWIDYHMHLAPSPGSSPGGVPPGASGGMASDGSSKSRPEAGERTENRHDKDSD